MEGDTKNPGAMVREVAALRARLWDGGFRPVPVYNADSRKTASPGKAPKGDDWTLHARKTPPRAAVVGPDTDALVTGILCDGLRAIDIDIDNPDIAHQVRAKALDRFGEAPMRYRAGSPRCLLVYRAKEGEPPKRKLTGIFGKVEVLGRGQHFSAFGLHPTGAALAWMPEAPGDIALDDLAVATEEGISAFFADIQEILGSPGENAPQGKKSEHETSRLGLRADSLQVLTALHAIPNTGPADWEAWNRMGMAIWAATSGAEAGRAAFHAWSETHESYDKDETDRRWDHYAVSPPTSIGAGTLFHQAKEQQKTQHEDPTSKPTEQSEAKLPVLFFDQIKPSFDADDFVEGLLVRSTMSIVYGQSNSGKTFFVADVALHVAAGRKWRGREVDCGAVLWLAMEGSMGIQNRIVAWCEHHGIDGTIPFAVIPVALNLLDPEAHTDELIQTIAAVARKLEIPVILTVVDTLSRAMAGGNENSPEDMGALVTNGTRIQQTTKSAVLWIHHSGKDEAKGARGHSLLRAATDTEIEIIADGTNRVARVTKQREMDCSGSFEFILKVVELGQNRRGKPVTSCVVEDQSGNTAGAVPDRRLKGQPARALSLLADLLATSGKSGFAGTPAGMPSVPDKWWRERFYEGAMAGAEQEAKKKGFQRVANELIERRIVGMGGSRVWICRYGEQTEAYNSDPP